MKVLVTGGSGFVGAAIIEKLLENNIEVFALLNQNSTTVINFEVSENAKKSFQIFKADIRNFESLKNLPIPRNIDAVIHSAGLAHQFKERAEKDFWDVNVKGTENVARLAAELSAGQFVLISSVSVYGRAEISIKSTVENNLTEDSECRPEGIYAVTKYESEKAARQICIQNQIDLTILRLATVIGEKDCGNVFRLIETIDKRKFFWIGDGVNQKSLIYKTDVARACLAVLKNRKKSEIYNLTANALTMKEIVEEIHRHLNLKNPRLRISPKLLDGLFQINRKTLKAKRLEKLSETVRKWLSDDVFSGEKFRIEFQFETATPIREAIGREVESYLKSK